MIIKKHAPIRKKTHFKIKLYIKQTKFTSPTAIHIFILLNSFNTCNGAMLMNANIRGLKIMIN